MSMVTSTLTRAAAFQTLGLCQTATRPEIEAAWKRLAFRTHPDRAGGDLEAFKKVSEAYQLLRGDTRVPRGPATTERPSEPRRSSVTRPTRHKNSERRTPVSANMRKLCAARLEAEDGEFAGHVPTAIRRLGRRVTYVFDTPLTKGRNTVAVPSGDLVDTRHVRPVVMTYHTLIAGAGKLEVTEPTLGDLFPGAHRVTLEFAST